MSESSGIGFNHVPQIPNPLLHAAHDESYNEITDGPMHSSHDTLMLSNHYGVKRRLKARHISVYSIQLYFSSCLSYLGYILEMIALGGAIGT
jgi:amino acid permease